MSHDIRGCDAEIQAICRTSMRRSEAERHARELAVRIRHHLAQGLLLLFSAVAIALADLGTSPAWYLAGNVIGLAAQPLWFWTSWRHRQWGIFILTIFYTAVWAAGIAKALPHFAT